MLRHCAVATLLAVPFPALSAQVRVASPDGRHVVRVEGGGEPEEVGERLAREALALGADSILREIRG